MLIQTFIEDVDIQKIQRTTTTPYQEMSSVKSHLSTDEQNEFSQYASTTKMDWTHYVIGHVRKRKDCFDKKNCYIILAPILSIHEDKAIVSFQLDRKTGGYMKYYLYERKGGNWKMNRELGTSSWLYCSLPANPSTDF